jgi:hypothetical protein
VIDSGFQMASTCNTCSGSGSTIPRNGECSHCGGVGKVRTKTAVQVDIIPGEFAPFSLDVALSLCVRRGRWDDAPNVQTWRCPDIWQGGSGGFVGENKCHPVQGLFPARE